MSSAQSLDNNQSQGDNQQPDENQSQGDNQSHDESKQSDDEKTFSESTRLFIIRLLALIMLVICYLFPNHDVREIWTDWKTKNGIDLHMYARKSNEHDLGVSILLGNDAIMFDYFSSYKLYKNFTERIGTLKKFQTILGEVENDPKWGKHYKCCACQKMYNIRDMYKLFRKRYKNKKKEKASLKKNILLNVLMNI